MTERVSYYPEPGIERNDFGRIIKTGWPTISYNLWPDAYHELVQSIKEQRAYEERIVRVAGISFDGVIEVGGYSFNLNGDSLEKDLKSLLAEKMGNVRNGDVLEVGDLGGGSGYLLDRGTMEWKHPHSKGFTKRNQIHTTMTTLTVHDREMVEAHRHAIDRLVVGMGIEQPCNDMYQKFDVVTAQNSIFYWSKYPELALLNLWKITKEDGVDLVTVPKGPFFREQGDIDKVGMIKNCRLFNHIQIGENERQVRFRLEKVI